MLFWSWSHLKKQIPTCHHSNLKRNTPRDHKKNMWLYKYDLQDVLNVPKHMWFDASLFPLNDKQ